MDEAQEKQDAYEPESEASLQEIAAEAGDLPAQEDTTAFQGVEDLRGTQDRDTGKARIINDLREHAADEPTITGGDIDANLEQAEVAGEEAVGGTAPTPDQNNVDELAAAVGTEVFDQEDRYATDELEQRDSQRWELEPKSSEDYPERRDY